MDKLQLICELIILFGAVALAIGNIANLCGKPIVIFKKRRKKQEEIKRKELIDLITESTTKTLEPTLTELSSHYAESQENFELLKAIAINILGEHIQEIYDTNKCERHLTISESVLLDKLYGNYVAAGGKNHIAKLYEVMKKWPIVDDAIPCSFTNEEK